MLRLSLLLTAAWCAHVVSGYAAPIRIVEQGQALAQVVIPAQDAPKVRPAAELLVQYVKQSSGAELPIVLDSSVENNSSLASIHIGQDSYVRRLQLGLEKLDDDGFVILGQEGKHLVIAGPTPIGTEFGVCEFLERYVGVRWLLPGPDGDDVPTRTSIDVPIDEVRLEPAFFSRLLSGFTTDAEGIWAKRNRMHDRVKFHHNLVNLFPWQKYAKSRPEFYSFYNGKRVNPTNNARWQPCFSAPGIVDETAKNICEYFDRHPQATSYSLGINDTDEFCECPDCLAKISGKKNPLGFVDYSDLYYDWANQVVARVLKKHPDKYFGCLAYCNVAAPPQGKLHPRLIPYLTYERLKWSDATIRAAGEQLTIAWHQKSPTLGWYDYIYGRPYAAPRVALRHMTDCYRWGHAHGVRAMYAEAYPNWGEGPKLYVSLKLQWDPTLNVEQLLEDWYARCVGPDAAPLLAQYYALWEDIWTRRIPTSPWFTKDGQYLNFERTDYLASVTEEDLAKCRNLLESVLARSKTEQQRARARLLLCAYDYYESTARLYHVQSHSPDAPRSSQDALSTLAWIERGLDIDAKRRQLVEKVLPEQLLLKTIAVEVNSARPVLQFSGWTARLIDVADLCRQKEGPVYESMIRLASRHPDSDAASFIEMLAQGPTALGKNQIRNGNFEAKSADWTPWIRPGTKAEIQWTADAARTGKTGLVVRDATAAAAFQTAAVQPRETYLVSAFVKGQFGAQSTIQLVVKWKDATGKWLAAPPSGTPPLVGAKAWRRHAAVVSVPDRARQAVVFLSAYSLPTDDYVCFDDVEFKKVRVPQPKRTQ